MRNRRAAIATAAQQAQLEQGPGSADSRQPNARRQKPRRQRRSASAEGSRAISRPPSRPHNRLRSKPSRCANGLKQQLNQVLQTTETARGLIVNMSDVLFDFNRYTLKPEAQEKLARFREFCWLTRT